MKNIIVGQEKFSNIQKHKLLEKVPTWLGRVGIMIYLFILGELIFGAYFFPCPEVIQGRIEILKLSDTIDYVGILTLPVVNSGNLKEGQKVNIQLLNYPYKKNGMLIGQIDTVYYSEEDNIYKAIVRLPLGLTTTYHRTLPFLQGLAGEGIVIIKEGNLLQRVISSFPSST